MGDWGDANLHRIAGWISYELIMHTRPETRTAIWSGVGGFDAVAAVARGEVDIGLATPTCYVDMALKGLGPYSRQSFPELRGLAVVPQFDRLILGIRKSLGVRTMAELRAMKPPLRIAMSKDDGRMHYGYAARELLEAHHISLGDIREWGGDVVFFERPPACITAMYKGDADAVLQEAIMMPEWQEMSRRGDVQFLSFEPDALQRLRAKGMPPAIVPAGYFAGWNEEIHALEFSDFLVFCRADLPDDVAYLIASAMVQSRENFERAYRHIPRMSSSVTYPLEPRAMARTIIPLHSGAEHYYREAGFL
jgi:TRAP-type uncharacterized transport system substrate-binding protein